MYADGHALAPCSETSGAYIVSSLTMIMGYCLFVAGIVSPSWRLEIGYTYGLWVRCDGEVCRYVFVGFTSFMGVVQAGIIISLLLLTTSMLCLLLEAGLRSTRSTTSHLARASKAVSATAAMGEVLAALTLAYYGYKTVMAIERLPVLATGFAMAGLATMALLMASILRAMGAPASWGDGVCCLAPTRLQKHTVCFLGSESPSVGKYNPTVGDGQASIAGPGDQKVRLISCCQKMRKGNAYSSVPSTAGSSLDRGYRHYEEIVFEDMPHPPLELLHPHALVHPGAGLRQDSTPPLYNHMCLHSHLDTDLNSASSSFQYLEQQQQQQQPLQQQQQRPQYTMYQQHVTETILPKYSTRSQQIKLQRSVRSTPGACTAATQAVGTATAQRGNNGNQS